MATRAKNPVRNVRPMEAFGPNGVLIATSSDGGKTWEQTEAGKALQRPSEPQPRQFTRRIAAVVEHSTPSVERRIATPFSVLHEADMLAGWAPYETLVELEPNSLDCIVIPNPVMDAEQIERLQKVARTLVLDLDAPMALDERHLGMLHLALGKVDAVTVPHETLASRLRTYHERVFVIPHLLRGEIWRGYQRDIIPGKAQVVIGAPYECGEAIEASLAFIQNKYLERVRIDRFDPYGLDPFQEREVYAGFDAVLVPPPFERSQSSLSPILPAMAGQCCIVADRLWPGLRHEQTGLYVGRETVHHWTQTINRVMVDSRLRVMMGRNARSQARRHTPEVKLHQVALPFRLVVPESDPVSYPAL